MSNEPGAGLSPDGAVVTIVISPAFASRARKVIAAAPLASEVGRAATGSAGEGASPSPG
ncbi:unannotated protein [freshwater metagenome]|uniref:Unannotated protein n=1 Tax=freshwater metagenome TaxID=449393 RepID=A0A6J6MW69_9ZZZZ